MYQGTTEKTCIKCGATFSASTSKLCNRCRTTDRTCVTCGEKFRGRELRCYKCRATDHPCVACGQTFHGTKRTCPRCLGWSQDTCQMPGCEEPKLRGRGHRYCEKHSDEGGQRESAQVVRRKRERKYGITHDEYLAMLDAQHGLCAICGNGSGKRALSVDRDHVTGAVRALLCDRCNPMLGHAQDNIAVLEVAIAYLRRFSQ